jgi:hypothetical protein
MIDFQVGLGDEAAVVLGDCSRGAKPAQQSDSGLVGQVVGEVQGGSKLGVRGENPFQML